MSTLRSMQKSDQLTQPIALIVKNYLITSKIKYIIILKQTISLIDL